MYFHRTQRCPTCLKMGSYSRKPSRAVCRAASRRQGQFHYVDFQQKSNAALTNGYKVSGPALIVAGCRQQGCRVQESDRHLGKVVDRQAFIEYVQNNVKAIWEVVGGDMGSG